MMARISATGIAAAILYIAAVPVFAQTPSSDAALSSDTSANWAGYEASGANYSGVGGTWSIPTPSVNSSSTMSADATWIGIGGVTNNDLLQAGTQAIIEDGSISYEAWYEALPGLQNMIPVTVHGGDSVTVSLTETSPGIWQISFTNITTGQQYQTSIPYASSKSSVEWIEEMPLGEVGRASGYIPLDNFGSTQFSGGYAIVNGSQENITATNAHGLTMVARNGDTLATPSSLSADGGSFSVARSSNSSSGPLQQFATGGWRSFDQSSQGYGQDVSQNVTRVYTRGHHRNRGNYYRQMSITIPDGFSGGYRMQFVIFQ